METPLLTTRNAQVLLKYIFSMVRNTSIRSRRCPLTASRSTTRSPYQARIIPEHPSVTLHRRLVVWRKTHCDGTVIQHRAASCLRVERVLRSNPEDLRHRVVCERISDEASAKRVSHVVPARHAFDVAERSGRGLAVVLRGST